jgi:hypothetical protein
MKRFMTILVLAMLVMAPAAMAANRYGWTISSSAVDPFVNTGLPTGGIVTLFLWLQCAPDGGAAAAEFDIQGPAGAVLAFTAMNGFLNAGGALNLLLATPCNAGPVIAGNWLCLSLPGDFCLRPSAANAKNVSVDCVLFGEHTNATIGFGNSGAPANCVEILCPTDAVEESSWGEIKGLYR